MRKHVGVKEGYDAWAPVYDKDGNPLTALDDEVAPALLPLSSLRGKDVLDLGCGTGRHTVRMVAAGARVVGVDGSSGMLAQARAKLAAAPAAQALPARLVEHDLTRALPLLDASFDAVLCALVLEHIADLPPLFLEMKRVLRPDGVGVITEMHPAMRALSQANFTDPATGVDVLPTSHAHKEAAFVDAATGAGFVVEQHDTHVGTAALVERVPRAAKYLGHPMLLALRLRA